MKNSERLKMMQQHTMKMRDSLANPSESTKLVWKIEDSKNEWLIKLYEKQEAETDNDDGISLTSEVRVR